MLKRWMFAALAAVLALGVVIAAEPIKLDLKTFKGKAASDDHAGYDENDNRLYLWSNGTLTGDVKVPEDGEYKLTLECSCTEADKELAKIKIKVGDTIVKEDFKLTTTDAKEYSFEVKLKKGDTKLVVEFTNDKYKENEYDLNFFLHAAKLEKK
jgi:Ca-dependent carbohydrate-binding module xylan-binding